MKAALAGHMEGGARRHGGSVGLMGLVGLVGLVGGLFLAGCGAHRAPLAPSMEPLVAGPSLAENHFRRDKMGDLGEDQLAHILDAPVYLEERARIGILPVATGYAVDRDLPVVGVPGAMAQALSDSGHFEVVSEVTTDWPAGGSVAGLRELAARYRAEYLLLYRHRFVDRGWTNAWALAWVTFIGGFIAPSNTVEVAGVVEATLFDVRSGTLLFTSFERVSQVSEENVWQNDRKRRAIKARLLARATDGLTAKVLDQVRRLAAARPQAPAVANGGAAGGGGTASMDGAGAP